MSGKENKRSPNFTDGEKTTLINLVHQHRSVLETKKTDGASNQKKSEVWAKLAEKFNATSGRSPRDAANLRSKYDDLKKTLRKKMGNNKREMYKTGGGPASIVNLSADEELLLTLIGPSTFGLQDRGGGDMVLDLKMENNSSLEILQSNFENFIEDNDNDKQSFRPSDAVNILKRPIQKELVGDEIEIEEESTEPMNYFPNLETYENPKKRKRNQDKVDTLIDEYGDLKDDKRRLLIEQTKYYKDKNEREKQIFLLDLKIKNMQKEEMDLKLQKLKDGDVMFD